MRTRPLASFRSATSRTAAGRRFPRLAIVLLLAGIVAAPGVVALATSSHAPSAPGAVAHRAPADVALPLRLGHAQPPPGRPVTPGLVNPSMSYASEPAPMGIADFGVSALASGAPTAPYSYATPIWRGVVDMSALHADSGPNNSNSGYITFQLNVVVVLSHGGQNYSYWIQDVASVETHSEGIGFLDNVWNFSSLALANSSVQGNGTVNQFGSTQWYSDGAGPSYPGNFVTLPFPSTLILQTVSSEIAGIPHVSFEYNDGYGWVTYDNVTFPFAKNFTDVGFVVDGFNYNPLGIFTNAELDYTGPGGTQIDRGSHLHLALEFWNGHNFKEVTTAWNHGGDTGEVIQNLWSNASADATSNAPNAVISPGAGSLGILYTRSNVGTVTVLTPLTGGRLQVGPGTVPFTGSSATVTVVPGTYNFSLWTNAGAFVNAVNVTVPAGANLTVVLSYRLPYPVSFHEQGLPAGTNWSVSWGPSTFASSSPWINFTSFNGSYSYRITPIAGFTLPSYAASIAFAGGAQIALLWSPYTYPITFVETNLPSGVTWGVTIGGSSVSSLAPSLVQLAPNGTATYTVFAAYAYLPTPDSGSVPVHGGPSFVSVDFSIRPAYVTGTVDPANATVLVDGSAATVVAGAFNQTVSPGEIEIEVSSPGYLTVFRNVSTTPGNASFTAIALTLLSGTGHGPGGGNSSGSSGLLGGSALLWIALAVAAIVAAVGVAIWASRVPRRPPPRSG